MSDQDRTLLILILILIQYQAEKGWGKRKNVNEGMISWSTTNSQKKHSENNMADRKENK